MTESSLKLFRVFPSQGEVEAVSQVLALEGIPSRIDEGTSGWNSTRAGGVDANSRILLIPAEKFEVANSLLELHAAQQNAQIDVDHYLNEFTDKELIEVVAKKHEWSTHDYLAAIELLHQRRVSIDFEQIAHQQAANLAVIRKGKSIDQSTLLRTALTAILGGPVGIFMGFSLWHSEETDPTGEKYFEYDSPTRIHGRLIFFGGLVSTCAWIAIILLSRI